MQTTHLGLKLAVIGSIGTTAVIGWLSFWSFGDGELRLADFIAQVWQPNSPVYWQWSRIFALIGYVTLWLSVMTGLSISSQTSNFWFERGTALSWHKFFTWTGLSLALLHAGVLLKDGYLNPTLTSLLLPFGVNHPQLAKLTWLWIGIGQLAMYGMLAIALGSMVKQQLAKSVWRYLHALALLAYVGVVAHGLFAGTDSKQLWLQGLYLLTNVVLVTVVMLRLVQFKFPLLKAKAH